MAWKSRVQMVLKEEVPRECVKDSLSCWVFVAAVRGLLYLPLSLNHTTRIVNQREIYRYTTNTHTPEARNLCYSLTECSSLYSHIHCFFWTETKSSLTCVARGNGWINYCNTVRRRGKTQTASWLRPRSWLRPSHDSDRSRDSDRLMTQTVSCLHACLRVWRGHIHCFSWTETKSSLTCVARGNGWIN
jgi:hypothetical protein